MRIWHIGVFAQPNAVNGVNATVWLIASQQAALGHEVVLLVDDAPGPADIERARRMRLKLLHATSLWFNYNPAAINRELVHRPPDLVHMHSVYIPRQALLARRLTQLGIPYVITPHGGMATEMVRHGRVKKTVYNWMIERRRFQCAAGITIIIPAEERDVLAFAPRAGNCIHHVGNPVDSSALCDGRWAPATGRPRLVFLGRFAVRAKGIDILIAMARAMPQADFHLYGQPDNDSRRAMESLRRRLPENVFFHDPVYGQQKLDVLTGAALYLHMARCEIFGISIAEAMHLRVPCAISDACRMADVFRKQELGLVLPLADPIEAARQLRAALANPALLADWSTRAKAHADVHFDPQAAAGNYIRVYEHILSHHRPQELPGPSAIAKSCG